MAEVEEGVCSRPHGSHRIKRGESDYPEIGDIVLSIGDENGRKVVSLDTSEAETES